MKILFLDGNSTVFIFTRPPEKSPGSSGVKDLTQLYFL